jgi:enamine deaminase RidA (YjgF/YER057c/UK114 family)
MSTISESAVVPAGSQLVVLSGQVSVDDTGSVVGVDDFDVQFRQVFANLAGAMGRLGGDLRQVIKCTTYLTNEDHLESYFTQREELFPGWFGSSPPANTLLIVSRLGRPDFLLEVEAMAAIPHRE